MRIVSDSMWKAGVSSVQHTLAKGGLRVALLRVLRLPFLLLLPALALPGKEDFQSQKLLLLLVFALGLGMGSERLTNQVLLLLLVVHRNLTLPSLL